MNNRQLFLLGVRHSIPICLGYISVGCAYAVMAKEYGFSAFETILMSMICYSGSGQFLAVTYAQQGASLIALVVGLLLLNFRYFIMSAVVFARFKVMSNLQRAVFSHYITDEPFAIFATAKKELVSPYYFSGLVFISWLSWISGALLGLVAHDFMPQALTSSMTIALYALFVAIIVPGACMSRSMFVIIVASALFNILMTQFMEECWAILTTIIVCSLFGAFFIKDRVSDDEKQQIESKEKSKEAENGTL